MPIFKSGSRIENVAILFNNKKCKVKRQFKNFGIKLILNNLIWLRKIAIKTKLLSLLSTIELSIKKKQTIISLLVKTELKLSSNTFSKYQSDT